MDKNVLFFQKQAHFYVTPNFWTLVRTSTLCMTQVIFPKIVYRQIISHIIHCITIPVGQKLTFTKLIVPLNSLENSRKWCHALEASERLIDIIWVNWRCTCGPTFNLSASAWHHGNSKEISQDLIIFFCRPPQVWFIIGSNFQMPEGTTFICTNNSTQV